MLLSVKTMPFRRNTFLVEVILLLHWGALDYSVGQHHGDVQNGNIHHLPCISNETTVICTVSRSLQEVTFKLDVQAEQTVQILSTSSENSLDNYTQCLWENREMASVHPFQTFTPGTDGVHIAVCGSGESNYSVNILVHIYSPKKKPSVPQLTVNEEQYNSASLRCVSTGNPKPKIVWYKKEEPLRSAVTEDVEDKQMSVSKINCFYDAMSNTKCCAKNSEGEECSQVYHYSVDEPTNTTETPRILLPSGQSLLLRCSISGTEESMNWYTNNYTKLNGVKMLYYHYWIKFYSITSVSVNDSGEYICKSIKGQTKTTQVRVFEKDLLDIENLDENVRILHHSRPAFCFQAKVISHPKAQCQWITLNGTKMQCDESQYLWGQSTFKLCNPEPGQYQLQLRAGENAITRNMSLCVTEIPTFKVLQDTDHVTCLTSSTVPLSVSWKTCSLNANCHDNAMWKEIPMDREMYPDSNQFCQKSVVISLPANHHVNDHNVKCCLRNDAGIYCSGEIIVKLPIVDFITFSLLCSLLIFTVMICVGLIHFIYKKKPGYESQLQMVQVVGPSDNDYIYIDFKDFKYDQRWEFPRENLELGKELGSGAFGMVMEATAYGISKPGVSMQVAVKMLKDKHQAVEKEALMSELKMLSHIGQHTNIVNLLGACTGTGPIYLIFQYCCHGDLLNYLKSSREHFYKSLTDAILKDRLSSLYHNCQRKRNHSEFIQDEDNLYMQMAALNKEQEALLVTPCSMDVSPGIFEIEDEEDLQTLTFGDLLNFSCQVAKGMEFLSSKNCIHRDLAARNVLVARGRIAKIGDFGLARDIANDSNYVVRGNACLPVKWMAPESIFKGMYTMQSDVWAYGILLWEIFSLGVTPYPGMKVDKTFYTMIETGFQMERPYYASEAVYNVMRRCWALEPKGRPCFHELVVFMESQLADIEEQLYHNTGGEQYSSIYQNAPVSLEPAGTAEEQNTCQLSATGSSCQTETTGEDADTEMLKSGEISPKD